MTDGAPTPDFLIRGSDRLAEQPDFKLVGRQDELNAAYDVLLKRSAANNLILHGQNGVGISTLVLGMQAAKEDPSTPFDIVGKSFFYLDTDRLFASGDPTEIREGFMNALQTLKTASDAVFVIEDTKGFVTGIQQNGVNNLVNILMQEARTNPKLQVIFEAGDEDLSSLIDTHSDVKRHFTMQDIGEPAADERAILENAAEKLSKTYGVAVSKEAIDAVEQLTSKYPGLTLNMAQPKRSITILEGALTAYCRVAHARAPELDTLEATLENVAAALEGRDDGESEFADKSQGELEAIRLETTAAIEDANTRWVEHQKKIRAVHVERASIENNLRDIDDAITRQKEKDKLLKDAREEYRAAGDDKEAQQQIREAYKLRAGEDLAVSDLREDPTGSKRDSFNRLGKFAGNNLAASEGVAALQEQRKKYEKLLADNKESADRLTGEIDRQLSLSDDHILAEFSRLSGLPTSKLKQDEGEKLLRLSETLKQRVFGQDEPIEALTKAVKRGRTGLKKPNKPNGNFLFIGPSGVGKTELAKALAEALLGDEAALEKYDMSEYGEKHASAVLIGAPPGYEGHQEGGLLVNNMRRRPYTVNLFDEIEKAHKQVFDIFLQILDEGVLTDRRGVKASFGNSINIMTSNIGSEYFLDDTLSFEEASEKALNVLWNKDPETGKPLEDMGGDDTRRGFRPEFLNRFEGNIYCFHRLETGQIKLIAAKSLREINSWVAEKGISVEMADKDLTAMCTEQYLPANGARGVTGYIANTITTDVADTLLRYPDVPGKVEVSYTPAPEGTDRSKAKVTSVFTSAKPAKPAAANANKPQPPKVA